MYANLPIPMQVRENNGNPAQSQPRAKETPLFMRMDGQEGFKQRSDSSRRRCPLAALSLQGITEARGAAFAVAERVPGLLEEKFIGLHWLGESTVIEQLHKIGQFVNG